MIIVGYLASWHVMSCAQDEAWSQHACRDAHKLGQGQHGDRDAAGTHAPTQPGLSIGLPSSHSCATSSRNNDTWHALWLAITSVN